MSFPTGLPNRRKFLERSALGAGGVLLLPGLLASCTDHNIPPTDSPIGAPEEGFDWSSSARIIVTHALGMIPEVGEIFSGLVDLFWPETKEDVWGEVKEQVEALLKQKIDALVYQQVQEDLQGLNRSGILYLNEVKANNTLSINTQWIVTRNLFTQALPHFQSKGYELLLLPLFAQFANLYLSVLRDAVAFGKSWGRNDAELQQDTTDLKNSIRDFTSYIKTTYDTGRANLLNATPRDDNNAEPFNTVNAYDRQMTLTALDFMNTWAYYDVTLYPTGKKVELTREIYTDPWGGCPFSGPIVITTPPPTQPPTVIKIWIDAAVNAAQVEYPAGSGPGGVTVTPRMGNQTRGFLEPVGGLYMTIPSNNPIVAVSTGTDPNDSNYYQLRFRFANGDTRVTQALERNPGWRHADWVGYPYEILTSIHINGIITDYYTKYFDCADCIVFGFQFWADRPAVALRAIRAIYVTSPKERSAAEFAQAFPAVALSGVVITDELKAARQAYWAYVQARAKALK